MKGVLAGNYIIGGRDKNKRYAITAAKKLLSDGEYTREELWDIAKQSVANPPKGKQNGQVDVVLALHENMLLVIPDV